MSAVEKLLGAVRPPEVDPTISVSVTLTRAEWAEIASFAWLGSMIAGIVKLKAEEARQ